jgi:hypothetical protein
MTQEIAGQMSMANTFLRATVRCTLLIVFTGSSAIAQVFNDSEICAKLLIKGAGLYLVQNREGTGFVQPVTSAPVAYRAESRFYYVPERKWRPQDNKGQPVWHIRTQTSAAATPTRPIANQAYVFRPGGRTPCSPTNDLPEHSPADRFVDLNRYIDYHDPNSKKARETGIRDHFHFQFLDRERCIGTDAAELGDLSQHYGFESTSRRIEAMQRTFTPGASAAADPTLPPLQPHGRHFSGLSSEFNYQNQPGPACIGFAAPLPTEAVATFWPFGPTRYQRALIAAEQWQPLETLLVIKRVTGRKITQVMRRTISWNTRP